MLKVKIWSYQVIVMDPKSSEIRKRPLFRFYNFISFVILRALNKNSEVENSKYWNMRNACQERKILDVKQDSKAEERNGTGPKLRDSKNMESSDGIISGFVQFEYE